MIEEKKVAPGQSSDSLDNGSDIVPDESYLQEENQWVGIIGDANGVGCASNPFGIVSGTNYINDPAPLADPVLVGFIDVGDKVALIGQSKSKKTWLGIQMAVCLASGKRFLGWEVAKPMRVLFVQLEVQSGHFHRRFKMVCAAMGVTADDLGDRLGIINGRGRGVTTLSILKAAKFHESDVVHIDPTYKLQDGDENSVESWKPMLGDSDRICEECRASVIYTLHDKKGFAGELNSTDRASGSGVVARDYDAALILSHHAKEGELRVLSTVKRNYRDDDPFTVEWDDGTFSVMPDIEPDVLTSQTNRSKKSALPPIASYMDKVADCFVGAAKLSLNQGAMLERLRIELELSERRAKSVLQSATEQEILVTNYGKGLHRKQNLYALNQRDLTAEITRRNREHEQQTAIPCLGTAQTGSAQTGRNPYEH